MLLVISDEESPSQYNDGDGIKVSVVFIPLPSQLKKEEKCCKNAKTLPINSVIHFNENDALATLLNFAINSVKHTDNLHYAIGNRTGQLSPENFSIKYTVPCSTYMDVDIKSLEDFNMLITQACKMKNPLFKLFITQTEVCKNDNSLGQIFDFIQDRVFNTCYDLPWP
ncbi:hypothetical protein L210DRAFT_3406580 [Boletus edulis BED1]|uniref:Uncharacterized protein n=1 Tax=Boletus edulis BED1 TaxID=1328754 RepID=A0AAD4BQ99_BOLED|nr:hypothetical protein L210DRAFT_3406580 [Boletus edulis BED1]